MPGTLEGIHADVLDIKAEQQRQGQLLRELYDAASALQRFHLLQKDLSPRHSISYQSEEERRRIRELVAQYRRLSEVQRQKLPALLNFVGKLEVVAGEFDAAQADFRQVAGMVAEPNAQAEAHYNAYRAALERRKWDEALAELKQAIALDAARYAPFPLDRYEPERILGAGGFGVAFLCRHRFMDVPVVVKALLSDNLDRDVQVVFNEARTLRQLHAPTIVRVSDDCGYADAGKNARPYLVMDYFDGTTLEDYVKERGRLSPEAMLPVAKQMAEGLRAAHAQKVLHRDVKPANVLISSSGQEVKLIDFGLAIQATVVNRNAASESLMGSSIAGTIRYAAPEQMGWISEDTKEYSDVYGFGKTCYYALFGSPTPNHEDEETLPLPLRKLLRKCVNETPGKRPQNFDEVLQGLVQPGGSLRLTVPTDVTVEAGGKQSFQVGVVREGCVGPVAVQFDRASQHISISDIVVPPERNSATATIQAEREAGTGDTPVALTATSGSVKTGARLLVKVKSPASQPPPPPSSSSIWPSRDAQELPGNEGSWLVFLPANVVRGRSQWLHFSWDKGGSAYRIRDFRNQEVAHGGQNPTSETIWRSANGCIRCGRKRGLFVSATKQEKRAFWQKELARLNRTVCAATLLQQVLGNSYQVRLQLPEGLRPFQDEELAESVISIFEEAEIDSQSTPQLIIELVNPAITDYTNARKGLIPKRGDGVCMVG
jgi:serine/threonine protein kinase